MTTPTASRALTREQARRVDELAIKQLKIPSIVLMENAGLNAAQVILHAMRHDWVMDPKKSRVAILCGGGNNGGDGYVIARHLHNHGVKRVTLYAAKDPASLKGDAQINATICRSMGLEIRPVTTAQQVSKHAVSSWQDDNVMVDALMGTGFEGEVRGLLAAIIHQCNALSKPKVVAVDIPSGLATNTGQPSNATVRAHLTVTFVAMKTGFLSETASPWTGRVTVADIGTPPQLIDAVMGAI